MIVLIDGPDGTGKTTVAKRISETLEIPYVKMPNMVEYFNKNSAEEFSKLFNETIVQFADCSFVLDRGFTSSLVYSHVYKRDFDLSYIDKIHKELNPLVIILTATQEKIMERRPIDDIIKEEFRDSIRKEYEYVAKEYNFNLVDTSDLTVDEVTAKVLSIIDDYYSL